ncbi:hypothetical protein ABZ567_28940 [Streptomyces sp. NPDC016459]|uniref:hypothetical protein n=1 Tax=Streptomyces sp. NPDC016459 TaxID=3157190 RepID=UPI0034109505
MKHKGGDAEKDGAPQLQNYIRYLTRQLRAKGDNRPVVPGFKFSSSQSMINLDNPRELITVESSQADAGVEVYTWKKLETSAPKPQPQPAPVAQPVPQPPPQVAPTPAHPHTSPTNVSPGAGTPGVEWNWDRLDAGKTAAVVGTGALLVVGGIFHAATGCATC